MRAERIGDRCQRLAEIGGEHLRIGQIVRDLAQAIHVVGDRDQARLEIAHRVEGMPHPGRARHFAECADMGQARRAIAGLEHDLVHRLTGGAALFDPADELARFLERPDPRGHTQIGPKWDRRSGRH